MMERQKGQEGLNKGSESGIEKKPRSLIGAVRDVARYAVSLLSRTKDNAIPLQKESETMQAFRTLAASMPVGDKKTIFYQVAWLLERMTDEQMRKAGVREQNFEHDAVVLYPGRFNEDLFFFVGGSLKVHLTEKKKLLHAAPDVVGEMSATATGGQPTAAVTSVGPSIAIRVPWSLCKNNKEIETPVNELMSERNKESTAIKAAEKAGLIPAQIIALLATVQWENEKRNGEDDEEGLNTHRTTVLENVRRMVESTKEAESDVFTITEFAPGEQMIHAGRQLTKVRIILDGTVAQELPPARVATLEIGDMIGAEDVFAADAKSKFGFTAIEKTIVLSIKRDVFLALRPQLEELMRGRREQLLRGTRNRSGPSVEIRQVGDEVMNQIFLTAMEAGHFVPRRSPGSDVLFECGKAEQMIPWLSSLGLLSYQGIAGWRVTAVSPDGRYTLERPATMPIIVSTEELIVENLVPVCQSPEETKLAIETYMQHADLTFEEARWFVENGLVNRNPQRHQFAGLKESFKDIQTASSHLQEWVTSSVKGVDAETLQRRAALARVLQLLLLDTTHRIGIASLLKNAQMRQEVFQRLDRLLAEPYISEEEFRTGIERVVKPLSAAFHNESVRMNMATEGEVTNPLKEKARRHEQWGRLYQITDTPMKPADLQLLQRHTQWLNTEVCPALDGYLRSICAMGGLGSAEFPMIQTRAKTASGIENKIMRMRAGNDGKKPRPTYTYADMPDAAGGRIIIRDVHELTRAMKIIEQQFNGRVMEKDDFYINHKKNGRPYRVVTYTVMFMDVPVEIQLQTFASNVVVEMNHDLCYKPYMPASLEEQELIQSLMRAVAMSETRERLQDDPSLMPLTDQRKAETVEVQLPIQHLFRLRDPHKSLGTIVSELHPEWKRQLRDASRYLYWQEATNPAAHASIEHGSMSDSVQKSFQTWEAFRGETLERARMENFDDREDLNVALDGIEADKAPLFVLEELAKDWNVEENAVQFLAAAATRFSADECAQIKNVLHLIRYAHRGQSNAIEKKDKQTGEYKYPSSLKLKGVPYWNHCVRVAHWALECGLSKDAVIAALLHDTVEDTDVDEAMLRKCRDVSEESIRMVLSVTRRKLKPGVPAPEGARDETRQEFMDRVSKLTGEEKIIKALDRMHNLLRAFILRDNITYLERIVDESEHVFAGEFKPSAALSRYALRFQLLLDAVKDLLEDRRKGEGTHLHIDLRSLAIGQKPPFRASPPADGSGGTPRPADPNR